MLKTKRFRRLMAALLAVLMLSIGIPAMAFAMGTARDVTVSYVYTDQNGAEQPVLDGDGNPCTEVINLDGDYYSWSFIEDKLKNIPEGYSFDTTQKGNFDLPGTELTVKLVANFVPSTPLEPATAKISVYYYDADANKYVGDVEVIEIKQGPYSIDYLISEGYLHIPDGYKPTVLGNVNLDSSSVVINVEKDSVPSTPLEPATAKISVYYYDADANEYVGDGEVIEIKQGPYSIDYLISEGYLHIPDGYKPTVLGNVNLDSTTLVVNVEKTSVPSTPLEPATAKISVTYYDVDANEYVGDGEVIEIKQGPYSIDYLISEGYLHIPDGYKPTVLGNVNLDSTTLVVNVEKTSVPSTPLDPATIQVTVSYYDQVNNEYVADNETVAIKQGPYSLDYLASEGYIHIPEGYKLVVYGNVNIDSATLVVNVKPSKTLRINWVINDATGANFADGSDAYTQELTWKHVNDDIAVPELTLAEGYKMTGWSIGDSEEQWAADLKTVNVGNCYVEDENGGNITITANVVKADETTTTTNTNTNNNNTVTASSNDSSDEVVKASTPADNTTKILPQTGNQGVVSPVSFVVVLCAALAGAAVYLFAIRKKLN